MFRRFLRCKGVGLIPILVFFTASLFANNNSENLEISIELDRSVIYSPEDIVQYQIHIKNTGVESFSDVEIQSDNYFWRTRAKATSFDVTNYNDPNNNGLLDPGETWTYSGNQSFGHLPGDVFILTAGVTANSEKGKLIAGVGEMLFSYGINMDIAVDQECVEPGDKIDVTLTTRLLIDEDAAKDPGTVTIIIGGVPVTIQLPETLWEARDLMIASTELNGGLEFDPFNPPAGIEIVQFCDQGNADAGRNTGNVLDECEPINTVRAPCTFMGEDDVQCEFPDWVFCYCFTIPEDFDMDQFDLVASDDFNVFKAEESPAGSGVFGPFEDITDQIESGGSDSEVLTLVPMADAVASGGTCAEPSVLLDGSGSTGSDLTYEWYDANDVLLSSSADPLYNTTISEDTDFTLIILSNVTGCLDTVIVSAEAPLCGTIAGTVFEDIDNDDDGDNPIASVEIKLLDALGAPATDENGTPIPNVFTDINGAYAFTNIPVGSYIVMEIQPADYADVSDQDTSDDDAIDAADTAFDDDMIPVELTDGEIDDDNDFIEEQIGSIAGVVQVDDNNDGIPDQDLANVEIKLLDGNLAPAVGQDGNPIPNVFTDMNGAYVFSNVPAGDYFVMEIQPTGYSSVSDEDTSDDDPTDANDTNFTDDMIPVDLAPGEDDLNNDFLEELVGSISGFVTEDIDNDDDGDVPLAVTQIKLLDGAGNPALDANGAPVANVFTDVNGFYEFVNLASGMYIVMEVQPAGYEDVADQDTTDDDATDAADTVFDDNMIPVELASGESDENNDFIEEQVGTISGNVSEDIDNDDDEDTPIGTVEIKLLDGAGAPAVDQDGNTVANVFTDGNGDYEFTNLPPGDYVVMEIQPAGFESVSDQDISDDDATDAADTMFDNDMIPVTLAPGEDDEDNNFIEEQVGTISGVVTEDTDADDEGDAPLAGVEIKLLDNNGNQAVDQTGALVPNAFTAGDGSYSFTNLPTGDYFVMEIQPTGYATVDDEDTSDDDATDANDMSFMDNMIPVDLAPGEDDENNDFVEELVGTITGMVSEDIDNNDTADAPLSTVQIKLLDGAGNPAIDVNGNPVPLAFTDALGMYSFTNLASGMYIVMEVQPAGYLDVSDQDTSDDDATDAADTVFDDNMIPVELTAGETDANNDFIEEQVGTISGNVTEDIDNDDDGDTNLVGVEIKLLDTAGNPALDQSGAPVANLFTDVNGNYEFTNLPPGDYVVMEVQPAGYETVSDQDTSDDDATDAADTMFDNDMIPVTLAPGEDDEDNDFIEEQVGTISGVVTEDTNADDEGDAPLEGIEIKLLDNNGNQAVDQAGVPVANVFTSADGSYEFTNLPTGDYFVMEIQPAGYATVDDEDTSNDDATDANDMSFMDNMIPVDLAPGEDDEDNDFVEELVGTISGVVFEDVDNNDTPDTPISSVQIKLLDGAGNPAVDAMGNPVPLAFTDANGAYTFTNLVSGMYIVMEVQPAGFEDVSDEDTSNDDATDAADTVFDDNMIPVDLAAGEMDSGNDFIEEQVGTISGDVTEDDDNDDDGDNPIIGVEIKLLDSAGAPALDQTGAVVANVFTDANGAYEFTNLPAGDYIVMEIQPAAYENVNDEDETDDDGTDAADTVFDDDMIPVTLAPGEDDENNDFIEEQVGTISGSVDSNDGPLENVEIKLLDDNGDPAVDQTGTLVPNAFTDVDGFYEFTNLPTGDYFVMEIQPENYDNVSDQDNSDDDSTDANDTDFTDDMIPVDLAPGEDDEDNDFLEESFGSISGSLVKSTAIIDVNGNIVYTDVPLGGLTVTLIDSNGAVFDTETTNPDGSYTFADVPSGSYTILAPAAPAGCVDVSDQDSTTGPNDPDGSPDPTDNEIPVVLEPGEDDDGNDFVDEAVGSISGEVTEDTNNDGLGEDPISGVEIKLLDGLGNPAVDANGVPIANQLTDIDGFYEFTNLVAGVYTVMEVQPANFETVSEEDDSDDDPIDLLDTNTTDDMIPVVLASGEMDEDNNFVEEQIGAISGNVLIDEDNDDIGDVGLAGVEIKLLDAAGNPAVDADGNPVPNAVTDGSGFYEFTNIAAGDYILMEVQPVDYSDVTEQDMTDDDATDAADTVFDDNMIPVTLAPGETDADNDFIEEQLGEITGFVYKATTLLNDDGDVVVVEAPVEGAVVTLSDAAGNFIASTMTDVDGSYEFLNLNTGDYVVSTDAPIAGCVDVSDTDESDDGDPNDLIDPIDNEIPVTVDPNEEDADNNFVDQAIGQITGTVLEDVDGDGLGDDPIENVEIQLLDLALNPVVDAFGNPVANVFTDSNGAYEFVDLNPGQYIVVEVQPMGYDDVTEGDMSDDDSTDLSDVNMNDNQIPVFLASSESDDDNDFIEVLTDPCADHVQSDPNTFLTAGVVVNPSTIGSENDIVNITFVLVNLGDEPLADVELTPNVLLFSGMPYPNNLTPIFAGDPNMNGLLDPGEIWFYTAVSTFTYNPGDTFIITGGATGQGECGEEVGGGADLLSTSGVNMDVGITATVFGEPNQECILIPDDVTDIVEGDITIDIQLTTRLLIDEDAAKNPGTTTIVVGGVPVIIDLPASQWEARDLLISVDGLNGGIEFDPFNPPAGITLTQFCEQGGADAGRNEANVLDECEPIETVRFPCEGFGEDDVQCEFPDWVFCYSIDYLDAEFVDQAFTVVATDNFSIWKADESPAGSGQFNEFSDVSGNVETGGSDEASIISKIVLPVELTKFVATKRGSEVELEWTTASELNNSHFMIEKSYDGVNYQPIGKVNGNGTTSTVSQYGFTDDSPWTSRNYYRLAQYDYDGSRSYSEVRTVDFEYTAGSARISLYPNPVVDQLFVESDKLLVDMNVVLFSVDGAKVIDVKKASNEAIDLTQLLPGQYFVKVYDLHRYEIGSEKISIMK